MNTTTIITHNVRNFQDWKKSFDSFKPIRSELGEKSAKVFRNVDMPERITVVNEWATDEAAHKFLADKRLKEKMQEAGVIGEPQIEILTQAHE